MGGAKVEEGRSLTFQQKHSRQEQANQKKILRWKLRRIYEISFSRKCESGASME